MIAIALSVLLLAAAPAASPPVAAPNGPVLHEFELKPVITPGVGPFAMHIDHGRDLDQSRPGFLLRIEGWAPNGNLAVRLVGPKGEIVPVITESQNMAMQADGKGTVQIPYDLQGLFPGNWKLQVGGATGVHDIAMQIPVVKPADATHKTAWLVFPGATKGGKPKGVPGHAPRPRASR